MQTEEYTKRVLRAYQQEVVKSCVQKYIAGGDAALNFGELVIMHGREYAEREILARRQEFITSTKSAS